MVCSTSPRSDGEQQKGKGIQTKNKEVIFMSLRAILSVGEDRILLETRHIFLRAAGYIVVSTRSLKEAIEYSLGGDFDVVILCHSIASKNRDCLTCWIRASGAPTPVVSISAERDQRGDLTDGNLEHELKKLFSSVEYVSREAARTSSRTTNPDQIADTRWAKGHTWRKTILCIDDEPNLLVLRRRLLEEAGYLVLTTNSGADGLKIFSAGMVDAVVLDYSMPIMNGGAVAAEMRQIKADVPLILLSGSSSISEEDLALFNRFVTKGDPPNRLLSAIEESLFAPALQKITQPAETHRRSYPSSASSDDPPLPEISCDSRTHRSSVLGREPTALGTLARG
jgi:CheY-like chemotaxis protein